MSITRGRLAPGALRGLSLFHLRRELRQRRLHRFVRDAWPVIEPDTPYVDNWHIAALCGQLERVGRALLGERRDRQAEAAVLRLLINIPPGTAKSLIVSVFFPAWLWAHRPSLRILGASYQADIATRDASKMRDLVESPWYQRQWAVRLKTESNAKTQFETEAGGWRIATSVGGKGTGLHPDLIIVDDPHTVLQAESLTGKDRDEAIRWFRKTLSTRGVSRGAAIIVVMQRLHQDDLSGNILSGPDASRWVHVCFPMRAEDPRLLPETEASRPAGLDPRKPGDLLWPELFPESVIRPLELTLGGSGTAGQMQQRPSPAGGGMFRITWFPVLEAVPLDIVRWVRFWDAAGTEAGGDWTVGCLMGKRRDGSFVIADVVRGQWSSGTVDAMILRSAYQDGRETEIREEQEPGSSGKAVIKARLKALSGYDYRGRPATGSKLARAKPLAIQAEAGNVALVRGPWLKPFLAELEAFPFGTHDDQVDGASGALHELTARPDIVVAGIRG